MVEWFQVFSGKPEITEPFQNFEASLVLQKGNKNNNKCFFFLGIPGYGYVNDDSSCSICKMIL